MRRLALGALLGTAHHGIALRELASAFRAAGGNAVHAAKALGVSHRTLRTWASTWPNVQAALDATRTGPIRRTKREKPAGS